MVAIVIVLYYSILFVLSSYMLTFSANVAFVSPFPYFDISKQDSGSGGVGDVRTWSLFS